MLTQLYVAVTTHLPQGDRTSLLADPPPNPAPKAPAGLVEPVTEILAWLKWGALVAGVVGLTICGIQMTIGRRNRSAMAVDGASGIPWVLGGLSVVAAAAGLVGVFLK